LGAWSLSKSLLHLSGDRIGDLSGLFVWVLDDGDYGGAAEGTGEGDVFLSAALEGLFGWRTDHSAAFWTLHFFTRNSAPFANRLLVHGAEKNGPSDLQETRQTTDQSQSIQCRESLGRKTRLHRLFKRLTIRLAMDTAHVLRASTIGLSQFARKVTCIVNHPQNAFAGCVLVDAQFFTSLVLIHESLHCAHRTLNAVAI
jgi:hypothetical protein